MSLLDKFKNKFESIGRKKDKSVRQKAEPTAKKSVAQIKATADSAAIRDHHKFEIRDDTGQAEKIIIRPLQTEKITSQLVNAQYTFAVNPKANKVEIRKAIKAVYDVEPTRIRIINMRGKAVRFGRVWSRRKNWKKVMVTLKPGDKIEVYEGV